MLFSLIAEAISSVTNNLNNLKCGFDSSSSDFGPDLFDTNKNDTTFNEFDLGWALSDFDLDLF